MTLLHESAFLIALNLRPLLCWTSVSDPTVMEMNRQERVDRHSAERLLFLLQFYRTVLFSYGTAGAFGS
jgi:hypothetical protein